MDNQRRGPRLPHHPPGTADPRAGRDPVLRRAAPGQGPAPGRGRDARRDEHRLLHPPGAGQPHRGLASPSSRRSPGPCSSTTPSGPTCSTSPPPPTHPAGRSPRRAPGAPPHPRPVCGRGCNASSTRSPARRTPGTCAATSWPPTNSPGPCSPTSTDRAAPGSTWPATCSSTPARGTSSSSGRPSPATPWPRCASKPGATPTTAPSTDLVGELSTRSEEFATWWAAHNVKVHTTATKTLHHPVVGDLELTGEALHLPGDPGLIIITYTVEPNSASAQALDFLASWSAEQATDTAPHTQAPEGSDATN